MAVFTPQANNDLQIYNYIKKESDGVFEIAGYGDVQLFRENTCVHGSLSLLPRAD